jgi:hypothetical protein
MRAFRKPFYIAVQALIRMIGKGVPPSHRTIPEFIHAILPLFGPFLFLLSGIGWSLSSDGNVRLRAK